ncbi:MAG: molecular chaperone [Kiloniellaceae bacterium]
MASRRTIAAETADLAGKAAARSNLYGVLAMVYREEPSADLLRQVRDGEFLAALSEAGVALGREFLDGAAEGLADDLAVEYTRLFVGPGKHIPPYESVQREGALWGKSTSDVAAFVERRGFAYRPDYRGLPDHVSVELEFMQQATAQEARAYEAADAAGAAVCRGIGAAFLEDHLGQWIPEFCDKVMAAAERPFYREMAKLTKGFMESELQEFRNSRERGLAIPAGPAVKAKRRYEGTGTHRRNRRVK